MDLKTEALNEIDVTAKFFDRSTRCLTEADSAFRPTPDMMTVASQVAHTAQVIDWFRIGAFEGDWRMDFEAMGTEVAAVDSLNAAREQLSGAWTRMRTAIEASSNDALAATLADNPILPGRPLYHVVEAIVDHTGHHRGALTVYSRLLGRVPEMPYAEE